VHLQLRGYSVFIDVERLEAGKFDNNLLQSIKQAKNFLLVLTPKSLDRCVGDNECKDWVHKVTVDRWRGIRGGFFFSRPKNARAILPTRYETIYIDPPRSW